METVKHRVVLVDDEDHIRLLIKTLVLSMNCEVVGEGRNGEEAIALFREKKPDLMLLDINMPLKTGEEALIEILGEFPSARIIMLTSLSDMETVTKCITDGAVNYIRKDTPLQEIKSIIAEML
jgi:two-component system chemotaxis response regulator CheY